MLVRLADGSLRTIADARRQYPDFDITRSWDLPDAPVLPGDEDLERYLRRLGFSDEQMQYVRRSYANASGDDPRYISVEANRDDMRKFMSNDYRILDGYDCLLVALAEGLDIRLNTVVESVDWSGDGVRVRTTDGQGFEADNAIVTLPLFPVVNALALNDTHLVLILLYATFFVSLGTLLMRVFIDQIPRELDEAAVIDGASRLTLLRTVILPLAAPGMLAVAVFVVVFAWNEFLFAFIFTATEAKTAPFVLSEMISSVDGVDWGILFAASTIQLLPVLLFVLVMNRFLVAGLTAGATKG